MSQEIYLSEVDCRRLDRLEHALERLILQLEKNNKSDTLSTESTTKRHLRFIYNRMLNIHKENKDVDYMIKFAEILDKEL